MLNKLSIPHFLLFLLFCLVTKAVLIAQLSVGEALIGMSLVLYCGFLKYLDHFAAKKVEIDFENRIKNLENKNAMLGLSKSIGSR